MRVNPVDVALDSLLWIASTALPFSFVLPVVTSSTISAYCAGAASVIALAIIGLIFKLYPEHRVKLAYRLIQCLIGISLGVLA